ncbi:cache domain-containing protein [Roseivivax sp. CAU 1761]
MRQSTTKPLPRAFAWIASAVVVSVLCAALFVAYIVNQRSNLAQQELRHDIVLRGADAIGLSFNTALKREWDSLHAVARNISDAELSEINDFMDAVAQTGGQVAWSGVADLEGRIVSGSNRLREGSDVSERRWFREGLRQPNVGNVFTSNSLGPDETGEKQSLLNLSTPVLDGETGEVTGVLVYSLRMAWVQNFLARARERLNIDVVVQNREGETLVDTRDTARAIPAAAVAQASLGRALAGTFQILDQADGLYAFSPNFVSDELPDFGWRVFAVLDTGNLINVLPQLLQSSVIAVSIAASFVLFVTLLVTVIVLRPIEDLAHTAMSMADGELEYPVESRISREAVMLSQALTRIQSSLAPHQKKMADGVPPLRLLGGSADITPLKDGKANSDEPYPARRYTRTRRQS